jgi:hypothetical protein
MMIEKIYQIVTETPNDTELGRKIRKMFSNPTFGNHSNDYDEDLGDNVQF